MYYPGVELVADTGISPRTHPYLTDHHIDGLMVLPLAIAIEAMAEAASVLAGRPLRRLAGTRMDAPVVLLPGDQETTLRICALRRADAVETVVRCSGSGFQIDHFRALFPLGDAPQAPGQPAEPRTAQGLGLTVGSAGGIVDGTDLYGPVFFQAGPFRRVAFLPEVTSRSCSALVRGADDRPWFADPEFSGAPGPDVPLVLGGPGLNDAIMHMLQACVPHHRMLPAGFEALTVSGAEIRGAVQVRAERETGPSGGWRVTAVNAAGHTAAALSGLRLRDVGPLEASAPWHPTLLAAALEGRAAELGLDPEPSGSRWAAASRGAAGSRARTACPGWTLYRARPAGRLPADRPGQHARGLLLGFRPGRQGSSRPGKTGDYRAPQRLRTTAPTSPAAATKTIPGSWPGSCASGPGNHPTGWRPGCVPSPPASPRRGGRPGPR